MCGKSKAGLRFSVVPERTKKLCYKHTAGEDQNIYVRMAAEISGNDLDFLALLDAENGQWTVDRVGVTKDIGFCQIAPQYHPEVVNDPNFYDPEWQLRKCYEFYKGGVTFYGKKNVWKTKKNFTCPE